MLISLTPDSLQQIIARGDALIVELTSTHCAPCKAVAQLLEQEVSASLRGWQVATLNMDEWSDWAFSEGVRSAPVVRFYRDGVVLVEESGLITRERLQALLSEAVLKQASAAVLSSEDTLQALVVKGDWLGVARWLGQLTDEQSRHPHIQRLRSLLSMHEISVDERFSDIRDCYVAALLAHDDAGAVDLFERLLAQCADPQAKMLAVALLDVFPDRAKAQSWRRQLVLV